MSKTFRFTLGADPEFQLIFGKKRADAKRTMEKLLPKNMQYDGNSGYKVIGEKDHGNIGWDGHSSTGEIRPMYSNDPAEVVANLKALFKAAHEGMPFLDFSTLSFFAPSGGHIHFSLNGSMGSTAVSALTKKLSSFYLPIVLSEHKLNLQARIRDGYGKINDVRVEPKGSTYTLEYRSPSAEWITTEKIAYATLCYLGVVFHEATVNSKKFAKYSDIVYKTDKQGEALHMLAIADYGALTEMIFSRVKRHIKEFELYSEFKKEIDYILNPAKVYADKEAAGFNIVKGWGLADRKQAGLNDLLSDKKCAERAEKVDLDDMTEVSMMPYNNDANVNVFANALAGRSALFGWRPDKTYFLFGLRKGIGQYIVRSLQGNEWYKGQELVTTIGDLQAADRLHGKIADKCYERGIGNQNDNVLDPTNGKVSAKDSVILVGIPYELRQGNLGNQSKEVKEFIKLIWEIDKGTIEPVATQTFPELAGGDGPLAEVLKGQRTELGAASEVVVASSNSLGRNEDMARQAISMVSSQAIEGLRPEVTCIDPRTLSN